MTVSAPALQKNSSNMSIAPDRRQKQILFTEHTIPQGFG
jgi:hypothetical protein